MKNYTSLSTSPLSSPLCSSDTLGTAAINLPSSLFSSSSSLLLSSPLSPFDTTADTTADTIADTTADTTAAAAIDSPALQQRKESVRFAPKVSIKKTTSRHSMTQQEKHNYWLQDHEFLIIKQRNSMDIKQIRQERNLMICKQINERGQCLLDNTNDSVHGHHHSNNSNKSSLCLRGLECGMDFEALLKKSFRFVALDEVFTEQEAQRLGDHYDDEAIAYAYHSVSNECQFRAERTALQDRKEIEDYIMYDDYGTI
jgi:hypothetical protein